MDVPSLNTNAMTYDDHELDSPVRGPYGQSITKGFLVHIPFDGDAGVFQIKPNATDGTAVVGNITENELVLSVVPPTDDYDLDAHIKRELAKVDFRLFHLRASTEYLDQQLNITIAQCVARRKKAMETRAGMVSKLGIPKRQLASSLAHAPPRPTRHVPAPQPPPWRGRQSAETTGQWDIFISHASPDKPYVEPLVAELTKAGVKVWYDKHSLGWGDPLRSGINKGLVNCRYAIVVLSKAFLAERKWTEHELSGLFAREELGALIILPIWHGITREDILKYDPALADRLAKISNTDSYQDIVRSVLQKLGRTEAMGTANAGRIESVDPSIDQRGLVAYAWYETKGPDSKTAERYVRKSTTENWYVFSDERSEHEGPIEDVAEKFATSDRTLRMHGYVRMQYANLLGSPAFEL
jgi:TIR domain